MRVAQSDPLRVELVLPASDHGQIKSGDQAFVRLEDTLGSERSADVIIVDPIIDVASGTFRVTLQLPNPECGLTSGLRCAVSFVAPDETVAATLQADEVLPAFSEASNAP